MTATPEDAIAQSTPQGSSAQAVATEPELELLAGPAGGVPNLIDTPAALAAAVERFAAGTGPVAVDAERASGFRYGQKTYLAQFKRAGAGIALIDTGALDDLSALSDAFGDAEWVFHAASQDLPGMRDLKMKPTTIFDTELAARLLGWPKVGLASVVERELGVRLAKEHSAQDWSERPLPASWLNYAALDVEVLLELRESVGAHLEKAGKTEWARQEFAGVLDATPPLSKVDPWRKVSGTHKIRDPRGLAIVRELWLARDAHGQSRDIAPGRVLRNAAIIAAANAQPKDYNALVAIREWQSRGTKRRAPQWYKAIEKAMTLPDEDLPSRRGPALDGPPQPRTWMDKRPEAAVRLVAARKVIEKMSAKHSVPAENLLQPDALRRLCWDYPGAGEHAVREFLEDRHARAWQIDLLVPALVPAIALAEEEAAALADADSADSADSATE